MKTRRGRLDGLADTLQTFRCSTPVDCGLWTVGRGHSIARPLIRLSQSCNLPITFFLVGE